MIPLQLSSGVMWHHDSFAMTVLNTTQRWSVRAALSAIAIGACMIVAGFLGVTRGLDDQWPIPIRGASFVVFLEGLGVLLAGQHRFTGLGGWVSNQGRSFERYALVGPLVLMATFGMPMYIASVLNIQTDRAFFGTLGLTSIAVAVARPWWFWHQPDVAGLRSLFGDWAIRGLYFVLGAAFVVMGLFPSLDF